MEKRVIGERLRSSRSVVGAPLVAWFAVAPFACSGAPPAPPVVGRESPSAAAPWRDPSSPASLLGTWTQEFQDNGGCQDRITIRQGRAGLDLSGVDCNTQEAYRFEDAVFDGTTLSILVASPQVELRYRLLASGSGDLEGEVDVSGSGWSTTYAVRWVKTR